MVLLRTIGTPHAHTYGYNLGFLRAIGSSVGLEGGRGVVDVYLLLLPTSTSADARHSREHI
jgi:hypothetical protein